jgi:transposase-like protein
MKQLLLIALMSGISFSTVAQDSRELARRRGFKDIKLGSPIDSVRGAVFKKDVKEKNEYPAKSFEVDHPSYKTIGEVKVIKIEVNTYKDQVYQINVVTEKDTRLMKGLVKSFGEPKYIVTTDSYNWLTDSLSLTFKSRSKKEIELTYRYYPLLKMMQADKNKTLDDIATDF